METVPRTGERFVSVFRPTFEVPCLRSRSWTGANRQKTPLYTVIDPDNRFRKKLSPSPPPIAGDPFCKNLGHAADLVLVHSFQMVFQVVELVLGDCGMFAGRAVHREMPQRVPDERDGAASVEHQRPVVVGDFEQVPGRALGDDRADHVACGPTGTIKPEYSKTARFSSLRTPISNFSKTLLKRDATCDGRPETIFATSSSSSSSRIRTHIPQIVPHLYLFIHILVLNYYNRIFFWDSICTCFFFINFETQFICNHIEYILYFSFLSRVRHA